MKRTMKGKAESFSKGKLESEFFFHFLTKQVLSVECVKKNEKMNVVIPTQSKVNLLFQQYLI